MTVLEEDRRAVIVSDDAIHAYRRDGAVLVRGFLDVREREVLASGLEDVHAAPSAMASRYSSQAGAGETLVEQFPSLRSPNLRALVEEGRIAELAARMMGTPSAQLVLDQVFYKSAGHVVATPWHQDTPFLRVRGQDMARVWLSADPSPRDVTVQVVRGSHLWNVLYDTATSAASDVAIAGEGSAFSYTGIGDARYPPVPDIEAHRDSFDILSWDIEPGDAIVFHGNVLHGASGKAGHPHRRRAFASLWGGPMLRYDAEMAKAMPLPSELADEPIPHGAPIGGHTGVFPAYWREA